MKVRIATDGAARGNPGPAGVGVVISDPDGRVLAEIATYLGERTNNQAEYQALIAGLEKALAMGATEAAIQSDSELMVRQIQGAYKVKNAGIRPLYAAATRLLSQLTRYTIVHVRREQNARADALANAALDTAPVL